VPRAVAEPARVAGQIVVGSVTALFLTSLGGLAIATSPVLFPSLWWATRASRSRAVRGLFATLAGLVMWETGGGALWNALLVRGWPFAIWSILVAAATSVAYLYTTRRL
jgi:hypothetical protein